MEPHDTRERELMRCLAEAEVLAIRFLTIPQRLIIDSRTSELDGPMIKVVEPASSAEERLRALKRLRPRFRLPKKATGIWWQRPITSLRGALGEAIIEHMQGIGGIPAARAAELALDELGMCERRELYRVIHGIGYRTLWE